MRPFIGHHRVSNLFLFAAQFRIRPDFRNQLIVVWRLKGVMIICEQILLGFDLHHAIETIFALSFKPLFVVRRIRSGQMTGLLSCIAPTRLVAFLIRINKIINSDMHDIPINSTDKIIVFFVRKSVSGSQLVIGLALCHLVVFL